MKNRQNIKNSSATFAYALLLSCLILKVLFCVWMWCYRWKRRHMASNHICRSHQLAYLTVGFWPGPWANAPYLETDRKSSRPVPAWHIVEEVSGANWQADGQTGYRALPASPRGGSRHARQLRPGAALHEEANVGRLCTFLSLVSQYADTTVVRWGGVDHYFVRSDRDFVHMPVRVTKYGGIMWQTHTHMLSSPALVRGFQSYIIDVLTLYRLAAVSSSVSQVQSTSLLFHSSFVSLAVCLTNPFTARKHFL